MKSKKRLNRNIETQSITSVVQKFNLGQQFRTKSQSSIFINLKNSEFLNNHFREFSKYSFESGDANNYFNKNLRNYDPLDIYSVSSVKVFEQDTPAKVIPPRSNTSSPLQDKAVSPQTTEVVEQKQEPNTDKVYSIPSKEQILKKNPQEEEKILEYTLVDKEEIVIKNMDSFDEEGEENLSLEQVEKLIGQATDELDQVAEENQEIMNQLDISGGDNIQDGSFFKFDPNIQADILRELEDAEFQAQETANTITELKNRITELMKKEKMTETDAKELEEVNIQLKEQMLLFDEKTKRIQFILQQNELFEKMARPQPTLQMKHDEDVLPKVIVCGTQQCFPKIILCEDRKKQKDVSPKFPKQIDENLLNQEKLANENAGMEGDRLRHQSDIIFRDQTIEFLQRQLNSIQIDMRVVCQENRSLNNKLQKMCSGSSKGTKLPCGKANCPKSEERKCPAKELESKLHDYSEITQQLERQLKDMEKDVKHLYDELTTVQKEREHLEQHRKLICCSPMCMPKPLCCMSPSQQSACFESMKTGSTDKHFRELEEKYNRLQDDFKSKLTEVACLRTNNDKLKVTTKELEEEGKKFEEKVKEFERTIKVLQAEKALMQGSKELMMEQEQQVEVSNRRFREAQDELEELRECVEEQKNQLDDYRHKYLDAQQEVEERKRQNDLMQLDTERLTEQVDLEIQRVKNEFQEKLQDLSPLPEILKTTQLKLKEYQQLHLMAEKNNEVLTRDLQMYKDKIATINSQMENVKSDQQLGEDEKIQLTCRLEELEEQCRSLMNCKESLEIELTTTRNLADENERKVNEKLHEISQLNFQLQSVREESARQVARNKDRCETVRRSMQNQISELERQLVQSKAYTKTAQKDRDDIRQKMQAQINNLHKNFEDAQVRIKNLQGHVNFLRDNYNNNAGDADVGEPEICSCGNTF